MKHEQIANNIYWAMEHGETEKVDKLIDGLIIEGVVMYAWWKDGEQHVGMCGTLLRDAIKQIKKQV